MNTLEINPATIQVDPKTGFHYITEPQEGADYVTRAEYIRRRYALDLEKDAQADPLYDTSLRKVMKRGEIVVLKQGIHAFIDWNRYKNYVFHRYRQMPKPTGGSKKK